MKKTLAAITFCVPILLFSTPRSSSYIEIIGMYLEYGKQVFYGEGECYTCHSLGKPDDQNKDNLLQKLESSFNQSYPRTDRFQNQIKNFDEYIYAYICNPSHFRQETKMPKYDMVLSVEEIFSLKEYLLYLTLEKTNGIQSR